MLWVEKGAPWDGTLPIALVTQDAAPEARRRLLRDLAARALRIAPEAVGIAHRDGQPPLIVDPPKCGLFCSSASRDGLAALALARSPVGVDVEAVGTADEIPWRVLHASEAARLRGLRASKQGIAFARLWTIKEAYLKALAIGLAREPTSFAVALTPGGGAVIEDPNAGRMTLVEVETRFLTIRSRLFAVSCLSLRPACVPHVATE